MHDSHPHPEGEKLLSAIKLHLPEIDRLLAGGRHSPTGPAEDCFYRFYHGSFKVYWLQKTTEAMVETLKKIGGDSGLEEARNLNPQFMEIIKEGTGITFEPVHNTQWSKTTRPILEAFFHAQEMLRCMDHYGKTLDHAPNFLPSGWASVLYLYNIR